MHLSSFTVYIILQLDSIRNGLTGAIGLAAGLLALIRFVTWLNYDCATKIEKDEARKRLDSCAPWSRVVILGCAAMILYSLIPGTKTAAASVIAPAIVNSSVVQKDIPELYELGVIKLKEALSPTPPPTTPTPRK